MASYTITRSGTANLTNTIEFPTAAKARKFADSNALLIAQYCARNTNDTITLTGATGKVLGVWRIDSYARNIYGEWRVGYGMNK